MEQLEATISKLKSELTTVQKCNSSSLARIEILTNAEHAAKLELSSLRKEHELLQTRLVDFSTIVRMLKVKHDMIPSLHFDS